jgi:hypothetical protein
MALTFEQGQRVTTPLGSGTVAYQRRAADVLIQIRDRKE